LKKVSVLVLTCVVLAAGCSSTADESKRTGSSSTSRSDDTTSTTTARSLSVETTPATAASSTGDPNASGSILMIKLNVGDVEKAQSFYGTVFGATSAAAMGGGIHILTFPKGGPGLVLLPSGKDGEKRGAFIMKVPNLQASKTLALANGATEQGTFTGNPGGQSATSVDLLDPWGNQIEILQLG
jgi:predicted enzyme related to lactoylglutathione lyase